MSSFQSSPYTCHSQPTSQTQQQWEFVQSTGTPAKKRRRMNQSGDCALSQRPTMLSSPASSCFDGHPMDTNKHQATAQQDNHMTYQIEDGGQLLQVPAFSERERPDLSVTVPPLFPMTFEELFVPDLSPSDFLIPSPLPTPLPYAASFDTPSQPMTPAVVPSKPVVHRSHSALDILTMDFNNCQSSRQVLDMLVDKIRIILMHPVHHPEFVTAPALQVKCIESVQQIARQRLDTLEALARF